MKLLPFARVWWPQIGACLPFLAPEFDFLLFVFPIQQFIKQLQNIFHSLKIICSSYTSSVHSSSGDRCTTPGALQKHQCWEVKDFKACCHLWMEGKQWEQESSREHAWLGDLNCGLSPWGDASSPEGHELSPPSDKPNKVQGTKDWQKVLGNLLPIMR